MTRQEEIEKVANEFYKGDEVSTFVVAAQWADKTMYERIIKWLINYCPSMSKDIKSTIQNLKNAMEE